MKPEEYFPHNYLADRKIFSSGVVCGMTIDNLMNPSKINEYVSRPDFLNTVFQLNIIDRGLLRARLLSVRYDDWHSKAITFPGYQCEQHGGIYTPDSLLSHAEHSTPPGYMYSTEPILISPASLAEYSEFFLLEYLVALVEKSFDATIELRILVETLFDDTGCQRFKNANPKLLSNIALKFPSD